MCIRDRVKSTEKNKGWLKHGKYPTMSAPVDIGGRVDGNKHEGTIGAHMKADADMGFKGIISEVNLHVRPAAELPLWLILKSTREFLLRLCYAASGDDLCQGDD